MKKFLFVLVVSMLFISCKDYKLYKANTYHRVIQYSDEAYEDVKNILHLEEMSFKDSSNVNFSSEYLLVLEREHEAIDKFQKEKLEIIAKYYLGE